MTDLNISDIIGDCIELKEYFNNTIDTTCNNELPIALILHSEYIKKHYNTLFPSKEFNLKKLEEIMYKVFVEYDQEQEDTIRRLESIKKGLQTLSNKKESISFKLGYSSLHNLI